MYRLVEKTVTTETGDENPSDSSGRILSIEEADALVVESHGWAESIARSVARAWGMDWRLDGLDGAAMEALIFCARRFQPDRGVPFRGYARRRIHEAATEAARKSRGWHKGMSTLSSEERKAREISVDLLNVFPELRSGEMSFGDEEGGEGSMRGAIRQLLMGATLLSVKDGVTETTPEELVDYKRLVKVLSFLEPIHQLLMWKVYWEGVSLRGVAAEWGTDGLNVIREHRSLLTYLQRGLAAGKTDLVRPKVRPGLKDVSVRIQKKYADSVQDGSIIEGSLHPSGDLTKSHEFLGSMAHSPFSALLANLGRIS
jgi:hypothetical protein